VIKPANETGSREARRVRREVYLNGLQGQASFSDYAPQDRR
jgi:hypothetical protein